MKRSKISALTIVIIVLIINSFGCKSTTLPSGEGSHPSATEAPKTTAPPTDTDPKTTISTALQKFLEVKSYRSIVKTKTSQAEAETELDFSAPDKFRIKNKAQNLENEIIAIGKEAYTRNNGGQWTKMPAGQMPSISEIRDKMSKEMVNLLKDFESLGRETLNGKETSVYKFKSSAAGEPSSKMWISTERGLPVRVETDSTYNGQNVQMVITYDYEQEINIELPKVN
jgi:outer membrane lipoprotein-sorting protein